MALKFWSIIACGRNKRSADPRQRIVSLAQRYRRYGAEMIYLKLRQDGKQVDHRRVERLYALERMQVRRRRRQKPPPCDRQSLIRPATAS
jgi:putative transposase